MIDINDAIMTGTSLMFAVSLIPELIKSIRNKRVDIDFKTLLITTTGLSLNLIVLINLNMIFSAITTSITVMCWGTLLVLKRVWK